MFNRIATVSTIALLAISLASGLAGPASAFTVVVNPDSNSIFTSVANGSFESNGGDGGTITGWGDVNSFNGVWRASSEQSFFGDFSAKSIPATNFNGAGFALADPVATISGATYVLSAYFYFDEITTAHVYVDNNDGLGDPNIGLGMIIPADTWVQVYDTFVAQTNSTTIRLIMDHEVTTSQFAYIDGVGVTLLEDFVAAQSVAEPATLALLGLGLAGLGVMRRRKLSA